MLLMYKIRVTWPNSEPGAVLRIRDILVRVRVRRSVPLAKQIQFRIRLFSTVKYRITGITF
jgi:hypothetical protein